MVRKCKKIVVIILLAIFFINISYIKVYGLNVEDMDRYSNGDQFKLVKNAYIYNVNYHKGWFGKKSNIDIDQPKEEDRTGVTLKKGEIVTYTDKYVHVYGKSADDDKYIYVYVKSGNKEGFINAANVEVLNSKIPERPSSIENFIKAYPEVKTWKEDEDLSKKIGDLSASTKDNNVKYTIEQTRKSIGDASYRTISNHPSREQAKQELEALYKEALEYPCIENDVQFMAAGYEISYYYNIYLVADQEYGIDDGNNNSEDLEQKFDKAYKNYKNASTDSDKAAALSIMNQVMQKMTEIQKNGIPDGETKTRQELWIEVTEEDSKKAEKSQENYEDNKDNDDEEESKAIYQYPDKVAGSLAGSLDDMIGDADKFIASTDEAAISSGSLKEFSKTYYNIFLTIGIVVATLVGAILGIKFMIGGAEEKANVKELLIPYIAGCVIIFGSFAIWKLVVTILSNSLT